MQLNVTNKLYPVNLRSDFPKCRKILILSYMYILGHIKFFVQTFNNGTMDIPAVVGYPFIKLLFPGKFAHSFSKLSLRWPFPLGQTGSVFHVVCRCALKKTTALQSKCWQLMITDVKTFRLELKKPKS